MERKPVHLVMVTAMNNNKYYDMTPKGDTIEIKYGRIDSTCTVCTKPISQWDSIYNSKVRKGYIDKSDLIVEAVKKEESGDTEYIPVPDKAIAEIVDRLRAFATKVIAANYKVSTKHVTQRMVDEAQRLIDSLLSITCISIFNQKLLELFAVIPRRMSNVADYLAKEADDFEKIIRKEQSLLDTLKGQMITDEIDDEEDKKDTVKEYKNNITILEAFGIKIEPTTDADIKKIKKELGSDADRYVNSWKVTNLKQEKSFKKFCKENGITASDKMLLWHGTRNENVWNILKTGLVLRPTNVVISGKMFGYGIYFAPKAHKSLGYTSVDGAYWSHGHSASGFMILHECAYKEAYDVHDYIGTYSNFDYKSLQRKKPGATCLHAHAGKMLRNDEIVFYREDEMQAKYLVEIK